MLSHLGIGFYGIGKITDTVVVLAEVVIPHLCL